ncbi:hypothetical protein BT69DRAFT_1349449 [Atractiella rhizophila]|nr:hypothetical protein BT69DRAFT_1349449 [Atractiella rhizophila]
MATLIPFNVTVSFADPIVSYYGGPWTREHHISSQVPEGYTVYSVAATQESGAFVEFNGSSVAIHGNVQWDTMAYRTVVGTPGVATPEEHHQTLSLMDGFRNQLILLNTTTVNPQELQIANISVGWDPDPIDGWSNILTVEDFSIQTFLPADSEGMVAGNESIPLRAFVLENTDKYTNISGLAGSGTAGSQWTTDETAVSTSVSNQLLSLTFTGPNILILSNQTSTFSPPNITVDYPIPLPKNTDHWWDGESTSWSRTYGQYRAGGVQTGKVLFWGDGYGEGTHTLHLISNGEVGISGAYMLKGVQPQKKAQNSQSDHSASVMHVKTDKRAILLQVGAAALFLASLAL